MCFFFNDPATTAIYTLSLHDALPIFHDDSYQPMGPMSLTAAMTWTEGKAADDHAAAKNRDRKSTRLNSSHANISYAVFCLKKKKKRISGAPLMAGEEGCVTHVR